MLIHLRVSILLLITVLATAAVFSMPPVAQDPAYHQFADRAPLWSIPNFSDVVSNLAFVVVGLLGLYQISKDRLPRVQPGLKPIYQLLFASVVLVGLGSANYHLAPDNASLVWDRIPIVIVTLSLFCIVIGDHIDIRPARLLILPLLIFGLFAVAYWGWSESVGRGDLRLYLLAQFLPVLLIPMVMILYQPRRIRHQTLWWMLGLYAMSRLFEQHDPLFHQWLAVISGHSLKHLASALALYLFYRMLRQQM